MKTCLVSILSLSTALAFSSQSISSSCQRRCIQLNAQVEKVSRMSFLTTTSSAILSSLLIPKSAYAEGDDVVEEKTIRKCNADDDCVSTANIKDTKGSYSPPWTFEVSPDEAFARIKGVLKSEDQFVITEVDDKQRYIRAYAKRLGIADADEVEFLVKGDDKVVLFRSTVRQSTSGLGPSASSFGANRKRIEDIYKKGAVFDLMGGGMTADSVDGGGAALRGNGPLGQLKSFYGMQSTEKSTLTPAALYEEDE